MRSGISSEASADPELEDDLDGDLLETAGDEGVACLELVGNDEDKGVYNLKGRARVRQDPGQWRCQVAEEKRDHERRKSRVYPRES